MLLNLFFSLMFILFLLLLVAFLVLFERNILGLDQSRKGPNISGYFGILQTILDGVKLLMKEYFINPSMRILFFILSPLFGFFLSIMNWLFIAVVFSIMAYESTVIFTLFIGSIMVYCVVWAGWGSNNTYSTIGAIRAVAQMISYEVVMGFFILLMIMSFGTFSWSMFHFLNFGGMNFFLFFFLFFFWFCVILAELNRTPFDLVEGESELVGGFNVEYSGSGFTLLFLSEYVNIWFMGTLTVLMFFYSFSVFMMSFMLVISFVSFIIHIRSLLPRFKYFDLIFLTWKIMLPIVTMIFIFFILFI
uniref:NADH-ubiquinone oxidoreductase chain 1 n=1 Tax=Aplidium conicum TaxID=286149 RepID=D1GKZ3_APLCO|nr:NADH dehydrogenase subunit 1 [Aplidium conicum]CAX68847.1 NADH dehydrogenase subunit 1 [Aplidium conicum]